ncbi:MAG: PKD domain-containing protein, partial [Bacteroidota bacterium]
LSSDNSTDYDWSFPGAIVDSSAEASPTIRYEQAGTYNVHLIVSNAAGSDTIQQFAYILAEATPEVDFEAMVTGRTLSVFPQLNGVDSLQWDFGDGNNSTDASPDHGYEKDGSYEVRLTAYNHCGATEVVKTVTISTPPVAGFAASVQRGCAPLEVNFIDQSSENVAEWYWLLPGATPDTSVERSPTVVYELPGSYSVVLQVTNEAGENTVLESAFVVVEASPTAAFELTQSDSTIVLNNTSTGATDYQWSFGDGSVSNEVSPTHQYLDLGEYELQLIAGNPNCGADTLTQTVSVTAPTTSVSLVENLDRFQLFPNPNTGQFTLIMEGPPAQQLQFRLLNILGQELHQRSLDFRAGHLREMFSFQNLAAGTYLVELRSETAVSYQKIIVDRK